MIKPRRSERMKISYWEIRDDQFANNAVRVINMPLSK